MLRHASIVSLPSSEDPEDDDDIVNDIREIDDLDNVHDDLDNVQDEHDVGEPFIDLEVASSQLHDHNHLIGKVFQEHLHC
jgi:hypothetical protein